MATNQGKIRIGIPTGSITLATLVACIALLGACSNPAIYNRYVQLPPQGWHQDSVVVLDVPIADTLGLYDMYINVRHNSAYPYSNLYLFVRATAPSGVYTLDTVEYQLADDYGKWYGKGFAQKVDNRLVFRKAIQFAQRGTYRFAIQQGMRADILPQVSEVGISIEHQDHSEH